MIWKIINGLMKSRLEGDWMIVSETEFIARYAETDQMGIIHHSNYPKWFEAGRTDFFRKLGRNYSKIEADGMLLPLTDLRCNFKSPARYEDEIVIKTKLVKFSCVRLVFQYEVFNKDGMLVVATGETSHAFTDKNLKPLNMEKRMPELFGLLNQAINGE